MAEPPTGTVTLLFSDIEGSTLLLRRLGDGYPELLARHRELLRNAFEQHRGYVLESEGDAFFVAFESATEAAAAAAQAQLALAGHEWRPAMRSECESGCTPASSNPSTAITSASTYTRLHE
jgi:class 3 adenylate cyclase